MLRQATQRMWLKTVAVLVLALLLVPWMQPGDDDQAHGSSHRYRVVKRLSKIRWKANRPFASAVIGRAEPVVLTESSALFWPAMRLWKLPELARTHASVSLKQVRVQNGSDGVFVLASPRVFLPRDTQKPASWTNGHRLADMSLGELFGRHTDTHGQTYEYAYFSGPVSDVLPPEEVAPLLHFRAPDGLAAADTQQREHIGTGVNVWMATRGVTAHMHYDVSHNFVVQLHGARTWLLLPPNATELSYSYPFTHPRSRQSQLLFPVDQRGNGRVQPVDRALRASQFTQAAGLAAYEVTLRRGDVLYVPPCWSHTVKAEEDSVGVSVLSPSDPEYLFGMARHTPLLGLSNEWPLRDRALAVRKLIHILVDKAEWIAMPTSVWLDRMYHLRFEHLATEYANLAALDTQDCWSMGRDQEPRFKQTLVDKLHTTAHDVLANLGHDKMPLALRNLFLMDYIEHIAAWAVGAHSLGDFVKQCL